MGTARCDYGYAPRCARAVTGPQAAARRGSAGAGVRRRGAPPLDQLDESEPLRVIRFGDQVDVKGVLAGTPDSDQCIRYLSKYLTKSLGESLDGQAQREHAARFVDALRFEPCAPTCPNWLRYGVQPKGAKEGMTPGRCRSKAHKPEHLGYAGRRVLVSRKWSNKTLAEHKAGPPDLGPGSPRPGRRTDRPAPLHLEARPQR